MSKIVDLVKIAIYHITIIANYSYSYIALIVKIIKILI